MRQWRVPAFAVVQTALTAANTMRPNRFHRLLASASLLAVIAAAAAGCQTISPSADTTGTLPPAAASAAASPSDAAWRRDLDGYGAQYHADPTKVDVALHYAQALRATGQRAQAVAVLERLSMQNPHDKNVLGEYGRALAEAGDYEQALDVLGRHAEAQRYYQTALKIVPDEPSVLSNLGLSYALSKDLPNAEATLRRAAEHRSVDPRVRQNLALVVGLQGRFAEAEQIAGADLPPDQAAANVAYLRKILARKGEVQKPVPVARAAGGTS
jgi:Flp pilus assembly protein TadD